MKIILKTDIEGLGDLGDVVEVKSGYARNYLFPKKFAMKYNRHNMEQIRVKREKHQQMIKVETDSALDIKKAIEEHTITLSRQAGKKDTLFGSVKAGDIAESLSALGFEVDRKKVKLDNPIKSLGKYQVPVRLFKDVVAEVEVNVVSANQPEETEENIEPADSAAAGEPDPGAGEQPPAAEKEPVAPKPPTPEKDETPAETQKSEEPPTPESEPEKPGEKE